MLESKEQNKVTSGTREWASSNVNNYFGCENNCVYCYAKKMAIRFGRKTEETWPIMELNEKSMKKGYIKRSGRIMYPTSHDITPGTIKNCILLLKKLLISGNEVLITTKPSLACIRILVWELRDYKSQIQFRFTITSNDNHTLTRWEPGAPSLLERIRALSVAFTEGFKTSISIEPFLDMDPTPLIHLVNPYVNETIWIGKLNYKKTDFNTWDNIQYVMLQIKNLPEDIKAKIRIKDSIINLYKKKGVELNWE